MSQGTHLFFHLPATQAEAVSSHPLPPGFRSVHWRPHGLSPTPSGLPWVPFAVWTVFHRLRIFSNRDYAVVMILRDGQIVHRSCVFPRYFRFPFMAAADLQIGDTWTSETCRGQGLAAHGLAAAIRLFRAPDRDFWYLCDESNHASIRVAEKVGFRRIGHGSRTKRLGLRFLGRFEIRR